MTGEDNNHDEAFDTSIFLSMLSSTIEAGIVEMVTRVEKLLRDKTYCTNGRVYTIQVGLS